MKFKIKHEIKGRIRVRAIMKHMTAKEADLLEYALSNKEGITSVRVNERTADVVLCYKIDRATVLSYLRKCHVDEIEAPESYLAHSGRALNNEYWALYKEFVCAGTNTYMHYTCSSDSLYLEGCKNTCKGKA